MSYKVYAKNNEALQKIKEGVDEVCELISPMLGPHARNSLYELGGKEEYQHLDDGKLTMREVHFEDPLKNLVAKRFREACNATDDKVGDGTTSTVVLAHAIFNHNYDKYFFKDSFAKNTFNPLKFKQDLEDSKNKALAELQKQSKPIEKDEDIWKVAQIASNSDHIADLIMEVHKKAGREAAVMAEKWDGIDTNVEVVDGLQIPEGLIHPYLSTNGNEAVFDEAQGLVKIVWTNELVEDPEQIKPLADMLLKEGIKRCVIFGRAFNHVVIPMLAANKIKGIFHFAAITFPTSDDVMEDYATATGAKFIDNHKGLTMKNIKLEDLGEAKRVVAYRNDLKNQTFVFGGKNDKMQVEQRIEKLKREIQQEKLKSMKDKLHKRIGMLSGGIGIIKVGAGTEGNKEALYRKLEDAIGSTKAAIESGIVLGGGLALKKCGDTLNEDSPLKTPLNAIYDKLKELAGGELKVGKNVFDATKVVETIIRNACDVATSLLCTSTLIANSQPEKFEDVMIKVLDKYFKANPSTMPK